MTALRVGDPIAGTEHDLDVPGRVWQTECGATTPDDPAAQCTRLVGHGGTQHEAAALDRVFAVWP